MEEKENIVNENSGKANVGIVIGIIFAIIFVLFIIIGVPLIIIIMVNVFKTKDASNTIVQNTTIIDNIIPQSSTSSLYDSMSADEELLYNNLNNERKILSNEVNSYEKYVDNKEKVKAFYDKTFSSSEKFTITLREYALKYAKAIVDSNKDKNEIYVDLQKIYDEIYDEIATEFYDDVYKGVLNDMVDFYYDGILSSKSNDLIDSNNYIEDRNQEYKWYSDTRTNIYNVYSKTKSDIYDFYIKIRNDISLEDKEKLQKDIKTFEEEISKLKTSDNGNNTNNTLSNLTSGELSQEFKNAMDTYEKFVNDYVEFMKKYKQNTTDLSLLAEYTTMLQKYTEEENNFDNWNPDNLTSQEYNYYIQVMNRVNAKLAEIGE